MKNFDEVYTVERELWKEDILSWLNTRCFSGNFWHSINAIARGNKMSFALAKSLVYEMATEGLVALRDGDTEQQILLVSVPVSLRTRHTKS